MIYEPRFRSSTATSPTIRVLLALPLRAKFSTSLTLSFRLFPLSA